jgi:peptidoglycan lytic transglycosylase G
LFTLAVAAVVLGARSIMASASKPSADPHGPPITVVIPPGSDAADIGDILQRRGVVVDAGRFRDYAKSQGQGSDFKAGTYELRAGTDYDRIFAVLDAGPAPLVKKLVVPEGYRNSQIAGELPSVGVSPHAWKRALRAAAPPPGFGHHVNMEGFMFPATYAIRPHQPAALLVQNQLAAFRENWAHVDMAYARSRNLTNYDVLTIASMIEREASVAGDRAKVAAVIYNRLRRGMALGIDATILYHLGSWTAPIHQSDLTDHEPYNTRIYRGLPPTPICNPGLAAMQAAAHPAHVDYLYYVAVPGKSKMYFTNSYRQFVAHGG